MNKATHKIVSYFGMEYDVYLKNNEWYCHDIRSSVRNEAIQSITPIPTPSEPKTFDWREAMRLFSDGVELERRIEQSSIGHSSGWMELPVLDNGSVLFNHSNQYRRKPTAPPAPKVTEYWTNVYMRQYGPSIGSTHSRIETAIRDCDDGAIARLKITVTEGEKLPKVEVLPV